MSPSVRSAGSTRPDVVACLEDGRHSFSVARTAVREAVRRDARVRFLRVGDAADDGVLAPALRAMRGAPPVPVTFEVVALLEGSEPVHQIAARCVGAVAVVVGLDGPTAGALTGLVDGEVITVPAASGGMRPPLGSAV